MSIHRDTYFQDDLYGLNGFGGLEYQNEVTLADPKRIILLQGTIHNRTGNADLLTGILGIYANYSWIAGLWDDSETAGSEYEDDTTDAQSATATDFPLGTTTDEDGFVIACLNKFDVVGFDIGTAQIDDSTTIAWTYWNGSAWVAFTPLLDPEDDWTSGGEHILKIPDVVLKAWAVTTGADTSDGGIPGNYFAIRGQFTGASTAPGTAAVADDLWVAKLLAFKEDVDDNAHQIFDFWPARVPLHINRFHGYISSAAAGNWVTLTYSLE